MTYDILVLDLDGTLTSSEKKNYPSHTRGSYRNSAEWEKGSSCLRQTYTRRGIACQGGFTSATTEAIFSLLMAEKSSTAPQERQSVTKDFRLRLLLPSTRLQTNTMWICSLIQNMRFSQVSSQTNIPNWNPKSTTCQLST